MKPFEIGQAVFMAHFGRQETFVTCPDCLGSKHVLVILGDGTEVTIECGGCDPGGYQPSQGVIRQYAYDNKYHKHTVTGVKVSTTGVEYELDNYGDGSYFTGKAEEVFATQEEAIAAGVVRKLELEVEENKRLMSKTKNARSWAWNATYHRQCIKRLERELEYHRSKVSVCSAKAKHTTDGKESA
uniref:Uncharacterized protein n=1 Tax=viral metagenome TaxID=1070528 RepID=A0A6H1ZM92_9ZZZZ